MEIHKLGKLPLSFTPLFLFVFNGNSVENAPVQNFCKFSLFVEFLYGPEIYFFSMAIALKLSPYRIPLSFGYFLSFCTWCAGRFTFIAYSV